MLEIFLHVPKACGTTFRVYLWENIHESERHVVKEDIDKELVELRNSPEQISKLRMLFGHICWGWGDEFKVPHKYYTILRTPIERLFSLYMFVCRRQIMGYLLESARDMTFAKFLTSGVTSTVDNGMVRQLCGLDRFGREPYNDMKIPYGEVTEEHLHLAVKNLRSCAGVGVMEKYRGFQDAYSREHNWPVMPELKKNVQSYEIPRVTRLGVELSHLVQYDWTLYEEARRLADEYASRVWA